MSRRLTAPQIEARRMARQYGVVTRQALEGVALQLRAADRQDADGHPTDAAWWRKRADETTENAIDYATRAAHWARAAHNRHEN